jgi:hypothetical protein
MAEHRVFLLTLEGDGWVLKEHASGKVVAQFRSKGEGERFARDWAPRQGADARLVVAETTASMEDEADYGRSLKRPPH